MKLRNELYKIVEREREKEMAVYALEMCKDSIIYKSHFPNHPVTPGVCIVQIAVELAEDYRGRSLMLVKVKNVKFLSVLSPDNTNNVKYSLFNFREDVSTISFDSVVMSGEVVLSKMSLSCKKM